MIKDNVRLNVLIIEDNMGDFTLIEDFLEDRFTDVQITHAKDFTSARFLLEEQRIKYDLILLDLSLPDNHGEALIAGVKFLCSDSVIIVLTGFADVEFSIKSLSMGVADYLFKDDINSNALYKSIIYSIERRKTTLQLVESEKRFSNLFHLSPQPMWVYDAETFYFMQVNKAAVEKYGYTQDEFLSMTILDIRPVDDIQKVKDFILWKKTNEKAENKLTGRFRHHKKSGEPIDVDIYSSPIVLDAKLYRSVIAIDVTEQIAFEQKLTKAIIKTQEDERYEIGGELHDNVCQLLGLSQLSLGVLQKLLRPSASHHYELVTNYINKAFKEIRSLSHRLAPAFFDGSTLYESFALLLKNFNTQNSHSIHLHFDSASKAYPLSRDLQLNLYRILQEQLSNIFKHAAATTIEVELQIHQNNLRMRIADDGVGFDAHLAKEGIGLANIKRRIELFSGKFDLVSSPGRGCEIVVDILLQR